MLELIRQGVKLKKVDQSDARQMRAKARERDVDPRQLTMPEIFEHLALRRECTQPSSSSSTENEESDW
jgi:hypothetical protein